MTLQPTLRRELIIAFAVIFASALTVALVGLLFLLPRFETPQQASLYVMVLVIADLTIFSLFGRWVLRRHLFLPIEHVVETVEAISNGDHDRRLPDGETLELARLSAAVNRMTERLVADQQELAANIRSLDETNRMLTEARDAMVRAEKMASVGRLSAGIAHEVGNPLGAIMGYLGIIARHSEGQTHEMIEAAEKEARRIDRIVRGLLDYARPRSEDNVDFEMNEVVRETVELVATQGRFENVQLQVELDDRELRVAGNPHQLQQVLVNLLVNATDALSDTRDPVITIGTLTRRALPPQRVPARRKDDHPDIDYSHRRRLVVARLPREDPASATGMLVVLTVADNGPGIPDELREQIFEPFVTTKEPGKGTGLGLAVCGRIIENMGGTIRVDPAPLGGALFTILLPALAPATAGVK